MKVNIRNLQIHILVVFLVITIGVFSFFTAYSFSSYAATDVTGPTVESLSVDKDKLTIGEVLTVTIIASDESDLADTGTIEYYKPNNGGYAYAGAIRLNRINENTFTGTLTITSNFLKGRYRVYNTNIKDVYGNGAVNGLDKDAYFTVTEGITDVTGPTVESLSVDKDKLTIGEVLTVTIIASDESDLADTGTVEYYKPNNGGYAYAGAIRLNRINENTFTGTLTITSNFLKGRYRVYNTNIKDVYGNGAVNGLDKNAYFTVTEGITDVTGPTVESLSVDKDKLTIGEVLTVTIIASDESDLADTGTIEYYKPNNGGYAYAGAIRLNRINENTFTGTLTITSNFLKGRYRVYNTNIKDVYGNGAVNGLDKDAYFTVTAPPDTSGPVIQSLSINNSNVTVGDTVTFTLLAVDDSGLASDSSWITIKNSSNNYKDIRLKKIDDTTLQGTLEITDTFVNGEYTVLEINVFDTVQNLTQQLGYPNISITVTGAVSDNVGPELISFLADKTEAKIGDIVAITLKVSDESGIMDNSHRNFISLKDNENHFKYVYLNRIDDSTLRGELKITSDYLYGKYNILEFYLVDFYGNQTDLSNYSGYALYVSKDGHLWNEEYTVDKEASCTEEGSKSIHCSVCNAIDDSTVTVIPASGHSFGGWNVTKEATCLETGLKERECSECGEKETESIPLTNHNWQTNPTIDKAATCTEDGSQSIHCAVCGVKDDSTVAVIPKTGHDWNEPTYTWKNDNSSVTASRSCRNDSSHKESETVKTSSEVTKAATYTEKGETTYTAVFTNEVFTKQTKTVADIPVLERVLIEKATVSNIVAKVYTGKALTQVPTVKVGTKTLKSGTDYKLTYKNNKNVGKATITITGIGAYKGTVSKSFNINPKPTTMSSVKAAKKGFTAKWKKQATQTTGYQIQYALNSKFTSGQKTVTITKNTTVSKKVTKLKARKKYYVRVRTYKTVSGVKYYSSWSKAITVTTKN